MITSTLVLSLIRKICLWIVAHKNELLIGLGVLFLIWLWFALAKTPKDIQIVMPSEETKQLERENAERVNTILNDIDRKRAEDDAKVVEASKSPTPRKKNVTAEELEKILNGKK